MDADPLATEYPAGDPAATAETFAAKQHTAGYALDFSLGSLETEVDRLLDLPLFHHGRQGEATEAEERNKAALGAYVGETLRRLFDGEWVGSFHPGCPILNFYRSAILFGSFKFQPDLFVSYRLTNGESEGSFRAYLRAVLPQIEARAEDGDPFI